MRRGTAYILVFVLLLVLVVAVSACGTSESTTTTSAAPATTATTSATPTTAPPTTAPASTDTTAAAFQGDPIELKMASMHAPTAPSGLDLEAWAEKIKEATNGTVTIRHYGSSQLIPGPDMPSGIRDGVADIGNSFIFKPEPGFEVGVNLTQLVRGKDLADGVRIFDALWAAYPDIMQSQWKDFKVLWIIPSLATILYTVDKPVRTMDDIKGLEIRVPNAITADFMKSLGASPVSMSTPDWITSLDKGTTDGGATTVGSMYDFRIAEKFKYATIFPMGNSINFLIMNMNSWNKLSPDQQKAIDDSLADARQSAINAWAESETAAKAYSLENGIEFIDLSPEEYANWNAAIQPVYDKMAADMDKAGYPGTDIVKTALDLAK
jgi:TRAP-type C4-dicarboxylate transport system substrate-binding protein